MERLRVRALEPRGQGRYKDARAWAIESPGLSSAEAATPFSAASVLATLAEVEVHIGNYATAQKIYGRAVAALKGVQSADHAAMRWKPATASPRLAAGLSRQRASGPHEDLRGRH